MKYLLLLIVLCACEPVVNNTTNVAPPPVPVTAIKPAPVDPTPAKSCPVVVVEPRHGLGVQGDMTQWQCTSNCTKVSFDEIRIYLKENSANGQVMVQLVIPQGNGFSAQQTWVTQGIDTKHTLINEYHYLIIQRVDIGQPQSIAQYLSSLDCEQLTINDAVFTYKGVLENGF